MKDRINRIIDNEKRRLPQSPYLDQLYCLKKRIDDQYFKITVVGEFSVGKSTFLNTLIGKRVLPSKSVETTATITSLTNVLSTDQRKETVEIHFLNGAKQEIPYSKESLEQAVTSYSESYDVGKQVDYVEVFSCFNSTLPFKVIDTPGLNGMVDSFKQRTLSEIKSSDMSIFVTSPKGISESSLTIIDNIVKRQSNLMVVINQIDQINEEEGESADIVVDQIRKTLNAKYPNYDFALYPLSSKNTLEEMERGQVLNPYYSSLSSAINEIFDHSREQKNTLLSDKLNEIKEQIVFDINEELHQISNLFNQDKEALEKSLNKHSQEKEQRALKSKKIIKNRFDDIKTDLFDFWEDELVEDQKNVFEQKLRKLKCLSDLKYNRKYFKSELLKKVQYDIDETFTPLLDSKIKEKMGDYGDEHYKFNIKSSIVSPVEVISSYDNIDCLESSLKVSLEKESELIDCHRAKKEELDNTKEEQQNLKIQIEENKKSNSDQVSKIKTQYKRLHQDIVNYQKEQDKESHFHQLVKQFLDQLRKLIDQFIQKSGIDNEACVNGPFPIIEMDSFRELNYCSICKEDLDQLIVNQTGNLIQQLDRIQNKEIELINSSNIKDLEKQLLDVIKNSDSLKCILDNNIGEQKRLKASISKIEDEIYDLKTPLSYDDNLGFTLSEEIDKSIESIKDYGVRQGKILLKDINAHKDDFIEFYHKMFMRSLELQADNIANNLRALDSNSSSQRIKELDEIKQSII